jgi:GH25 family lysozyme M1 (1,4-beta-N-acetylmuramidase)
MVQTVKARGIDVSYSQGRIDWDKVKADGIGFAILRCGYGDDLLSQDDAWFARNAAECERVGMPYGVYLFSYATTVKQAKSEAAHALRLLKGRRVTWPVFLDLEDPATSGRLKPKKLGDIVTAFCEAVEKAGYQPGVYASKNWFTTKLTDPRLDRWPRWVAQYNSECTYGGDYAVWQFTSKGTVDGIAGHVDRDLAYVDFGATPVDPAPRAIYRVRANGRWLPSVTDLEDYAGVVGQPVTDVAIKVTAGKVKYRVHVKNGRWLPYVTGYDTGDYVNGYAGIGKPIDAIEIVYTPPKGAGTIRAKYRVSPLKGGYWPWQFNADKNKKQGLDGYAGVLGVSIDRLQITLS